MQEQQARLLETQKGQESKIPSCSLTEVEEEEEQEQPVALVIKKTEDINAKDNNCLEQSGKHTRSHLLIVLPHARP